jgi:hypothetical protein
MNESLQKLKENNESTFEDITELKILDYLSFSMGEVKRIKK